MRYIPSPESTSRNPSLIQIRRDDLLTVMAIHSFFLLVLKSLSHLPRIGLYVTVWYPYDSMGLLRFSINIQDGIWYNLYSIGWSIRELNHYGFVILGTKFTGGEDVKTLEEKVRELSPELQQEVEDFVEFLIKKRLKRARTKPKFNWAGSLRDLRDQYTSVELQHKISAWRIGLQWGFS